MRPHRPSLAFRPALVSALVAILVFASLPFRPSAARACVGPPPQPVCGKNLTLAFAGPTSSVLASGGVVDVGALVFLQLLDFPQGLGACPAGPYAVDITATVTCNPGPGGSGQLLGAVITPGYNELSVPITMPSGPARDCVIAATATVRLADGMELTETADNVLCVVDPVSGSPERPRLGLDLLGPPGTEIARQHPGDQASHTYRITNNDPTESFSGLLTADMLNESRLPGMSGPQPPGTGVFSISDPVAGDNFDIAFEEDLQQGCVPLSLDPLDPAIPVIENPLSIPPLGFVDVTIHSRSWGMCADGSCGRSTVRVAGEFADTSPGLACSGFVHAADTSEKPDYGWADAGEVGEFPEPSDPNEPELRLGGEPFPEVPIEVLIEILQDALRVNGALADPSIVFTDRMDAERGRIQLQYVGDFPEEAEIDFVADARIAGADPWVVELLSGPTGFETEAPAASLRAGLPAAIFGADAYLDATYQISVTAIDSASQRRPYRFGLVRMEAKPGLPELEVELGEGFLEGATGNDLLAIEVSMDLRGFLSPELQGGIIFTDGFESGNVTSWSLSSP